MEGLVLKHKTAELEGALLDAAVAKAEGWIENPGGGYHAPILIDVGEDKPLAGTEWRMLCPWSTEWQHGGPLIERERIMVTHIPGDAGGVVWCGTANEYATEASTGPTPLIAAMRAYTASVFGEEVELP